MREGEAEMDYDLLERLRNSRQHLHERALAFSHPGQNADLAPLYSGLALIMEALEALSIEHGRNAERPPHQ
jgi:hypothetical protein